MLKKRPTKQPTNSTVLFVSDQTKIKQAGKMVGELMFQEKITVQDWNDRKRKKKKKIFIKTLQRSIIESVKSSEDDKNIANIVHF